MVFREQTATHAVKVLSQGAVKFFLMSVIYKGAPSRTVKHQRTSPQHDGCQILSVFYYWEDNDQVDACAHNAKVSFNHPRFVHCAKALENQLYWFPRSH